MGAKTSMLVYGSGDVRRTLAESPPADWDQTSQEALALFPKDKLVPCGEGSLSWTYPPKDELLAARISDLTILAAREFALERPSKLDRRFLLAADGRDVYLHAMLSTVDWCAFAVWRDGALVRSLSIAPDNGVIEDIGDRLPFEQPFWAGLHPALDPADEDPNAPYPLPFHPLDLGETALRAWFGYQLEGPIDPTLLDPYRVPLMKFKRRRRLFGLL